VRLSPRAGHEGAQHLGLLSSPTRVLLPLLMLLLLLRMVMVMVMMTLLLQVGMGDRACVDLCSLLAPGEGMLVGSFARALFLVHSECEESAYINSRWGGGGRGLDPWISAPSQPAIGPLACGYPQDLALHTAELAVGPPPPCCAACLPGPSGLTLRQCMPTRWGRATAQPTCLSWPRARRCWWLGRVDSCALLWWASALQSLPCPEWRAWQLQLCWRVWGGGRG
jgi:hypothetical protein